MSSHRHECSVQSSKSILDPLVLQCCRMNDLRHNYAFLFGIRVCLTELKNQNPFEFCKYSLLVLTLKSTVKSIFV